MRNIYIFLFHIFISIVPSHASNWVLNNPYPNHDHTAAIFYSSFAEQPKTLDPAQAYASNEYQFIAQIYEPLLQYSYLQRPYTLTPLTTVDMPQVRYLYEGNSIKYSVYRLRIKPGIFYQPHPALAKNSHGNYKYLTLTADYIRRHSIHTISDFSLLGTRELIADDYIYQIKRLASPQVNSPIYSLMSEHIVGFSEFAHLLPKTTNNFIDLRNYNLAGLNKIDDYTFEITIKGQYPQFIFWLAMPFFAPMPWEADRFYAQAGMERHNLTLAWYPIGTGPFMLSENNPNGRMTLKKNPHFHAEYFPAYGTPADITAGYLQYAQQLLPLIQEAIFTLEKEAIPRWNKFLQGYYDTSGISADSFDAAIQISPQGEPQLTPIMQKKNIRLVQTMEPSIFYLGFNMLDPIVGGNSEKARKLRLAISIAVNYEENITLFLNGRGIPAQGPIPPSIFGYRSGQAGINPYVYTWDGRRAVRLPLAYAKKLLAEAGYPNGKDPITKQALILHYDVPASGSPDDMSQLNWMRKQFASLGIDLNIRATQYNRFQDKMRSGNAQIFFWGWHADYPDPENFLFMLYGPNGKVKYQGENATNYANNRYDALFNLMKNRSNDDIRQKIIDEMIAIVRHDAPWAWGIYPQTLTLSHQWVAPTKPNAVVQNSLKYLAIDVSLRNQLRKLWNQPLLWPLGLCLLLLVALLLPVVFMYRQKEKQPATRLKS